MAKSTGKKKNGAKPTATRNVKTAYAVKSKGVTPSKPSAAESVFNKAMPWILIILAVFISFSYAMAGSMGSFGKLLNNGFRGINGSACFAIPVLCLAAGILWMRRVKQNKLALMVISQFVFFVSLAVLLHVWTGGFYGQTERTGGKPGIWWTDGSQLKGAGFVGGLLARALFKMIGLTGIHIVCIPLLIVFGLLSVGITPYAVFTRIASAIKKARENRLEERRETDGERAYQRELAKQKKQITAEKPEKRKHIRTDLVTGEDKSGKKRFTPDVDIGDGYSDAGNTEKTSESEKENEKAGIMSKIAEKFRPKPVDEDDEDLTEDGDDGLPPFAVDTVIGRKPDLPVKTDVPVREAAKRQKPAEREDDENLISESESEMLNRFAREQKLKEQKKNAIMAGKEGTDFLSDQDDEEDVPVVKKEYVFPPVSLLKYDLTPKNTDISEELSFNANKLVETLRSFKVETRLVDVSRGPAITRYELAPKEGVRVKQIANLVDDIALNLATTGVRIEAPIPGKAAVGVEVPNKTVSTVYLRELVDTESFRAASSKLNVCLGMDVAGQAVYLDIAKMPHLLIAGATGMGKSVCINSIITSLLYKASPDDVRMILIDPKKVEFNLYKSLPHLLVPVVSDPKKAAGSLQWAVTEMERRFELIEGAGVRDIKMYNTVTADDPNKEHMTQIVIIIDELADLMMTAPDDVENSICRIAQKARAAGMHLIIGTQRPSVDVVTGLIKANVPSRIAFTVASITDSRVILDMGGAEKLIGRGDMLYAPVGASKPRRVQGAFVSESEVEAVVNFIKDENAEEVEYGSDIVDAIERAAASIGNKKGSSSAAAVSDGADDEENDPMLRQAIELAVDSGKISTSLIQRKLSLGYGRAAKLIDKMENMGIVSPPEGQKPRDVLISRQQYIEMFVASGDDL